MVGIGLTRWKLRFNANLQEEKDKKPSDEPQYTHDKIPPLSLSFVFIFLLIWCLSESLTVKK